MATTITDAALYARELQHNAEGLLSDAQILFAHERWARAFALAVLAQEEAGKALLAMAEQIPTTRASGRAATTSSSSMRLSCSSRSR